MTPQRLIVLLAIALAILHQDFWNWDSDALVFGFMPIGLFYHACYSLAAVCLWALTIKIAWPRHIEDWAEGGEDNE